MKNWIKIPLAISLLVGFTTTTTAMACTTEVSFASASDDGAHEDTHTPKMAIDGNMDNESRWSSKSTGSAKNLDLKLSAPQKIGAVGVAWLKGSERASKFSIAVSVDGKTYTTVIPNRQSSGTSNAIETYTFTPVDAQFVRISGTGNTKNDWNSVVEAKAFGCS